MIENKKINKDKQIKSNNSRYSFNEYENKYISKGFYYNFKTLLSSISNKYITCECHNCGMKKNIGSYDLFVIEHMEKPSCFCNEPKYCIIVKL